MNLDAAVAYVIDYLKNNGAGQYGYDYFPSKVARDVAFAELGRDPRQVDPLTSEYYPYFEEAGWVLCLRGILRPGLKAYQAQPVDGGGYSLTLAGRAQLETLDETAILLFQSSSLRHTLQEFGSCFGPAFEQRSVEAVAARDASLWMSSCVMCGAAAEAVLLALAEAKTGDIDAVLNKYRGAQGRKAVLGLVVGSAKAYQRDQLTSFTGIISHWRDEAGHGFDTGLSTANADEALRQLLHMCQWTSKHWDALTSRD